LYCFDPHVLCWLPKLIMTPIIKVIIFNYSFMALISLLAFYLRYHASSAWCILNFFMKRSDGQIILIRGLGYGWFFNVLYLIIKNIIYGYQILNIDKKVRGESISSPPIFDHHCRVIFLKKKNYSSNYILYTLRSCK